MTISMLSCAPNTYYVIKRPCCCTVIVLPNFFPRKKVNQPKQFLVKKGRNISF